MKKTLVIFALFLSIGAANAQKLQIDIIDEEQDLLFYRATFGEGKMKNGKKEGNWVEYRMSVGLTY